MLIIVCARNERQADAWAVEQGLGRRDYVYIGSANALRGGVGQRQYRVEQLPGFTDRADAGRIIDALQVLAIVSNTRQRPGGPIETTG